MIPRFVLNMAWRETRASWRRLSFLVFSIAVGVAGVTAVRSFGDQLQAAINQEARSLSAADLSVESNRPFDAAARAAVDALAADGALVTPSLSFRAMASAAQGAVRLVDVRGVGPAYPFYGKVETVSGAPFRALLRDDTALVHPSLLLYLNIEVGDTLRIGQARFTITGEILREPDATVALFQLGPRVLLTEAGARATGLVLPTSRVRYGELIKLGPTQRMETVLPALEARLADNLARVRTLDEAQPRVRRFMGQLEDYLSLLGLVALLLGGIGVAGAIRVFIHQKLDTLAILKCLGATSQRVLAIYGLQALLLGLVGSLLGLGLGALVQQMLRRLLADFLPVTVTGWASPAGLAEGLALGLLTTAWFALPPLWRARRTPPARVFRRQVEQPPPWRERWRGLALTTGLSAALLAALVLGQSHSWQMGWIVLAVLGGTLTALVLGALGLVALLQALPRPASFILRQSLSGLYRPGNQTVAVVAALGLGVLLVLTVFLIRTDLLRQVAGMNQAQQPNLYLIDIQPGQQDAVREIAAEFDVTGLKFVPLVRARIRAINGERLNLESIEDDHERRRLSYEYALTYRGQLEPGETVLAGTFERDPAIAGAQVSVAEWWHDAVGYGVGDRVTFEVQGVAIPATITSVRKVDWSGREANFSFVFLPGTLEGAPQIFVTALHIDDTAHRVRFQQLLVGRLPNVSVVDADQIIVLVQAIMNRIASVVQFMALLSVAAGLVILVSTISTTKYQRLRESVLLKTLGATRSMVGRMLTTEYAVLGVLAGAIGAVAAGVLSWGLVTLVFNGSWDLNLPAYLAGIGIAVALIATTGLVSSLDVLLRKPLQVLREE
jgi:putative ABC transport system permease protein